MNTHFFSVNAARAYGVNAAIILQNLAYWCEHNRANDKHFYDGRYWTYNSMRAFSEIFDYMGVKQIRNALQKLEEDGAIVTGNFNSNTHDRTMWYSVTDAGFAALAETETCNMPKGQDASCQNGNMQCDETAECILPKGQMEVAERANGFRQKGKCIDIYNNYPSTTDRNHIFNHIETGTREDDVNPFGDVDGDRPRFDTVQAYATNNLKAMGARAMEELNAFVETTSEEVVRHAIDNAMDSGVRTWAYVRAILNKYEDAGIKTAGDAKAFDDKRKHPDDATAKPTQEDDDLRPRPVTPNPADLERIYDDNHLVIGWKILRTGETVMLSDYSKMTFGEQERFWDSKHIRWINKLIWGT